MSLDHAGDCRHALLAYDGPTNMAADTALLHRAEEGIAGCRVYLWDGPWVTLGRFQKPETALTPGWERWVQRPTGGRAVLHGHDVTVAFAYSRIDRIRSVREVYRDLTRPLISALQECGIDATLAERRTTGRGGSGEDCFGFASAHDIVDRTHDNKICGCALRVTDRAALLQASIPYMSPLIDPSLVISGGISHPVATWPYCNFADLMQDQWSDFVGSAASR